MFAPPLIALVKSLVGRERLMYHGGSLVSGELKITRRRLPHWSLDGAMYFVTFRVHKGELTESERILVLEHIKSGDNRFYTLVASVVMPDHVHVMFMADRGYSLEHIMKGMKGVSSRMVNRARKTRIQIWQHESFDRIVRSQEELYGKLLYMVNNPVEKGISRTGWKYIGWYCNEEYFHR
jgi:REP element-mobilizing transposase RayT